MRLLKQLIEIPSISGNEQKVQEFIYTWLSAQGLHPFWQGYNVLVKTRGKDASKALIFNAHVDTVSEGEISTWRYDPFKGVKINNKLYGLGTSDEKGSVAGLMHLALKLFRKKPPCDIWLTFVTKEETDGSGTESFLGWFENEGLMKKYKHLGAILMEPTGLKKVETGHRGNVFIKLTTRGDSGHGSKPEKIKKHCVFQMVKALSRLAKLQSKWEKKYSDLTLGSPSIGLATSINAGSILTPNKFPLTCEASIDIRTTPKLHNNVVRELKRELSGLSVKVECLYKPVSFGITNKNEPLVKAALKAFPDTKIDSSPGSTDQCFFTEKNIPAIVYGAGESNQMHKVNEFCYPNKIGVAIKHYQKIIYEWVKLI